MSRPLRGNLAIFAAMRCPMRSVKKANRSVTSVTCQKCESNYHSFLPGAEGNSGAQSYLIRRCCVNRNRCRNVARHSGTGSDRRGCGRRSTTSDDDGRQGLTYFAYRRPLSPRAHLRTSSAAWRYSPRSFTPHRGEQLGCGSAAQLILILGFDPGGPSSLEATSSQNWASCRYVSRASSMYVLRAHLKHLSAMTRYSAAVFMESAHPNTVMPSRAPVAATSRTLGLLLPASYRACPLISS